MRWYGWVGIGVVVLAAFNLEAFGQLTADDMAALRAQGEREGWTFTVVENPATQVPLSELCGLVEPDRWWADAPFDECAPTRDLPPAFDWRNQNGHNYCTPIRNQGGCGSCWAFATMGPLEININIVDGVSTDLSEQWLVSCNQSGWSCSGGWWAHSYHQTGGATDHCGGNGAVLESGFPYKGTNAACNCPYQHPFHISSWAYIGTQNGVPPTNNIKQAIMDHGPVCVAVYVNSAFQSYGGGIFNGCENGTVNHGVVLVGWDDSNGGYWIMRNSWGRGWGESGYMRIQYGCSRIGYAATYVAYPGGQGWLNILPAGGLSSKGHRGGPFTPKSITYTLQNISGTAIDYQVTNTQPWVSLTNAAGAIPGGGSVSVTAALNSDANSLGAGLYDDTVSFVNTTNHQGDTTRAVQLHVTYALGDMNCDGVIDFSDVDPFVMSLWDPAGYQAAYPNCDIANADCNSDGSRNFADIDPFVAILCGGG